MCIIYCKWDEIYAQMIFLEEWWSAGEIESGSSARAVNVLNHGDISVAF